MNISLWVVQTVLAVGFLFSGSVKSTWSKERLIASGQTGLTPFPLPVIRVTAIAEILAAIGLIAPRATGIAPVLTPLAAVGLCVVMVGAISSHTYLLRGDLAAGRGRGQVLGVAVTLTLLALSLFVAIGRA
jgi:hypothetical protein